MFVILISGTLFAAEEQKLYQYPITSDSTQRLIYTAQLLGTLQSIFYPALQARGAAKLIWNFDWNQNYVGAGSSFSQDLNEFSILLYGGQIRIPKSNFEVLATTLCHELGHFLGGSPKQIFFLGKEDWSSSEGQSDWFASKECLPKVYDQFIVSNPSFLTYHNQEVTEVFCNTVKDVRKCQWILGAVESWAQVLSQIYESNSHSPSLQDMAIEIAHETLTTKYPTMQCRLDTLKEGAFCTDRICSRPACWFKKEVKFSFECLFDCSAPYFFND